MSEKNEWKTVPVEPTAEMWAAVNKLDDEMAAGAYDGKGASIEQVWACLVDAAPSAPQASEAVRDALKTCGSKVFKALAAIARAEGPDTRKADDPELIYREPVMDEAVRIRQAYDELSAALSAQPGAQRTRGCE